MNVLLHFFFLKDFWLFWLQVRDPVRKILFCKRFSKGTAYQMGPSVQWLQNGGFPWGLAELGHHIPSGPSLHNNHATLVLGFPTTIKSTHTSSSHLSDLKDLFYTSDLMCKVHHKTWCKENEYLLGKWQIRELEQLCSRLTP